MCPGGGGGGVNQEQTKLLNLFRKIWYLFIYFSFFGENMHSRNDKK